MQRKTRRFSVKQVAGCILIVVLVIGVAGGLISIISKNNPKLPTYTATAEPYKNLQKFSY